MPEDVTVSMVRDASIETVLVLHLGVDQDGLGTAVALEVCKCQCMIS